MTKNKKPVLLIDGNNLSHRAYHTHQLSHKGKSVSMIYGVPNMVRSLLGQFKPYKAIVVWDGKKHKERLTLLPTYKAHRKLQSKDRINVEDFVRQKVVVQKLLKNLGIPQVWHMDMEADDYIYMLSQKYFNLGRPVIICSNDKDFHQLICPGISQWMDKKNLRELITHINFKDIFGVKPTQWVDYLCLVGDSTDDIPGYKGIGEKKGVKFLQDYHSILDYLESEQEIKAVDKTILKGVYNKNRILIDLEFFYMTHIRKQIGIEYLFGKAKPKHNTERYQMLCQRYNLRLFSKASFIKSFLGA